MTVLSVKSISKTYHEQTVLSSIDFQVGRGEWVGVVGESGSGKSTLLKIIGRFVDADKGEVHLNGTELPSVLSQLLKGHEQIKLVHQEYELFPNQTVQENIAYALRFYERGYQAQRVAELLELTRLTEVKDRKAKLLSGGEKQRTALAQALAEVPELLLLDEPFAHLDQKNKNVLIEAIEELKKSENLTCIFVTHDANEALALADQLLILKEGELVQKGTPHEVYSNPNSVYVAELTGMVNDLETVNQDQRKIIRPNYVKLTRNAERSKVVAVVRNIRFKGAYYEYHCQDSIGRFIIFSSARKVKKIGDEVLLTYADKHSRELPTG
ncbi:ABC transporter ATP-binding protein [Arundinibacter roseus]|uniref:ABC transporter ATP-binding protein n=1 Tax=Arundinibacter roseus TaxID=2070510 RepID=A0A4R4KDL8_9BACT|nr:ABC transporter ATP-binding protein [Arundinibacter roseus]TDB64459.1 ABC transporter ATP-binding protein [Arundinibacter roseus]